MKDQERLAAAERHEVDPRDWDRTVDGAPVIISERHQAVLDLLSTERWTQSDAIKRGANPGDQDHRTNIDTRQLITELVGAGIPIISSSKGYALASCAAQIDRYLDSLKGRIGGIQARIDALTETRERLFGGGPGDE